MTSKHIIFRQKRPQELIHFLVERFKCSRKRAKGYLDQGCVFVNQKRLWMAKHLLHTGDTIELHYKKASSQDKSSNIPIVFEDAALVIVNKPVGILSNGPHSIETQLQKRYDAQLRAAHRLDKETSGLLICSRTEACFEGLKKIFQERKVVKIYHALVLGVFPKKEHIIRTPIQGKSAISKFHCLKRGSKVSYLTCQPITGRQHQIRIHLAGMGFPILGDMRYLTSRLHDARMRCISRHMLHAAMIQFPHPLTRQMLCLHAPLPKDFQETQKRFL